MRFRPVAAKVEDITAVLVVAEVPVGLADGRQDRGPAVERAEGAMVERRGRSESIEKAVDDVRGAVTPLLEGELLRVTAVADLAQAVRNGDICLFPGDTFPLALAALADALERI